MNQAKLNRIFAVAELVGSKDEFSVEEIARISDVTGMKPSEFIINESNLLCECGAKEMIDEGA